MEMKPIILTKQKENLDRQEIPMEIGQTNNWKIKLARSSSKKKIKWRIKISIQQEVVLMLAQ